ncbi:hypothetical protein TUM17576_43590 [Enterobacter hormaechei]|nr:hypothetical protein [Enterobacter hormaechei]GJL37539.1 hypothetical protein TUM17576_43590 [Enterobacter hormaechei]
MKDEKLLSRFMRNTAHHNVIIERDEGVYRHLIFKAPGTNSYRFDIITWPGYLTVTGDMGTWTFSREWDMVTHFFPAGTAAGINPGYWSEKFESWVGCGRHESPCYEFDAQAFDKGLQEWLASYLDNGIDEDDAEEAKEAISELTGRDFSSEAEAFYALKDACFPRGVSAFDVSEGMGNMMTYSVHYLWICYAIVWGIERYNTSKLVDKTMSTFLAFDALGQVDSSQEAI